ncbi:hypothetical protein GJ744_006640 [Endocarpon pusillum]|uniref:RING-type domain-containing protein n=1 Tax=Endocarpon pusillum TaxID=364733 RepID=A0A8H7AW25_9EURO|nr:hypothetical protein GJ744_006640 [Endocarpon pusillum]
MVMSGMQNGHIASEADDICPVCKNSTYLQKNLRFKINTKCYHRICEGCVDRITSTQKKCPIAGCTFAARGVIPRRGEYRVQTFEDLAIEREVDIRKRVMAILNRREEEFYSKRAWDDFLEQREELIMNLVLKTDVKKTEATLSKYKEANADSIKANAALERNAAAQFESRQTLQKEQANLRRQAAQQTYEDDRFHTLTAGSRDVKAGAMEVIHDDGPVSDPSGLVKGLRKLRPPSPEKVYDPFMGMATTRDYYGLQADYPSMRLTKAKNDTRTRAGGFDFQAYYDESLLRAFAGLGCFIDKEKTGQGPPATRELATVVAAESLPGRINDEVF